MSTTRLGRYDLVALLGRGGMAEVWHARVRGAARFSREVAIKVMRPEFAADADLVAMFIDEACIAAKLEHPNIVGTYDFGRIGDRYFMVLELVDGASLRSIQRVRNDRPLSLHEAVHIVTEVAAALDYAHTATVDGGAPLGLVHRDINPSNIMLTKRGETKLTDFGVAKTRMNAVVTEVGNLKGKIQYMSPEQASGEPVDARSDIYALGLTLYELLSGTRAIRGRSEIEVLDAARRGGIERLGDPVPAPLADVVARALARDPGARFATTAELRQALMPFLAQTSRTTLQESLAEQVAAAMALERREASSLPLLSPVPKGQTPPLIVEQETEPGTPAPAAAAQRRGQRSTPRAGVRIALLGVGVATAVVVGWQVLSRRSPPVPAEASSDRAASTGAPRVSATRRITFDPGCEGDPIFSPDGKTVIYDGVVGGNFELFSLDVATGARRQLLHRPGWAWNWGGTLSPDGTWLAWTHTDDTGRQLELMHADGSDAPLGLGPSFSTPAWTASGALIVSPDGRSLERIAFGSGSPQREPLGSLPEHTALRYLGIFDDGEMIAVWEPDQPMFVLGTIGADLRLHPIRDKLPPKGIGIAVAPSQRAFYYSRHGGNTHELFRHARGSGVETIVPGGISPVTFSFSRDGKRLVYSTCREARSLLRWRAGVPLVEVTERSLSQDNSPATVDAARTLFASDRGGASQIWLLDEHTRALRTLTDPETLMPAASRDGRWFAYVDRARRGLFIAPVAGGTARRLTDDASDSAPVFSRDGTHVVFERASEQGTRIWVVATSSGEAHALSVEGAGARSPAVSPLDDRVVFLQDEEGGSVLMAAPLAGDPRPMALPLPEGELTSLRISPDGKRIAFMRNYIEVKEMPLDGSAPASTRWHGTTGGLESFDYAADGAGFVLSVTTWDGDLWLAEGDFP